MPRIKKEPTLAQEANLPDSWHPVDSEPINPQQGAPPRPNAMPPYFDGTISPNLQHDAVLVGTKYGTPAIPVLPLMPLSASGNSSVLAAAQNITTIINSSTPAPSSTGTGNMNFRGQWNSTTLYNIDDVVLDNISCYIAVTANINFEPDSGASTNPNWSLLGKNFNFRGQWIPPVTPATIAFVQTTSISTGGAALVKAFTSNNAAHNTIIVYATAGQTFASGNPDPGFGFNISDSQGNTYTQVGAISVNNTANTWLDTAVFVASDIKAGANTVTVTPTGGNSASMTIAEYTGNAGVTPVVFESQGVISGFFGSITSISVPVTTTQQNQIVVLFSGTTILSGGETPPAGFNTRQASTFYDKTISTPGSAQYALTYSGSANGGLEYGLALTNVNNVGANYFPFDTVIYRGSTYVCIKENTVQVPTNTTYWYLLSQGTGGVVAISPNYNVTAADDGQLLTNGTSSNYTANLQSPPPSIGWWAAFQNSGSGTLIINPTGLTIDGSASNLTLNQNQGVLIFTDGINYFTERGFGTITALPSIFNVSNIGVATLANEAANTVFAGPVTGAAAPPTFRRLVTADIPSGVTPSFNRQVVSTTSYATSSSDAGKALDVQTSSATTVTLSSTPVAPTFDHSYGFNRLVGNQTTGTLAPTLTLGNLAIITVECYRITTDTITVADTNGNVWHKVPGTFITNNHNPGDPDFGSFTQQIWYSVVTVGGATTITATFPITVNYPALYGGEATSVNQVDQATSASGNGVPSSGNITTVAAATFVYGSVYDDSGGSSAAGSGWTFIQHQFNQYTNEYHILNAQTTLHADTNQAGTVQYTAAIASFSAAAITPFSGFIQNNGTAIVTITPQTGLINGLASITLYPGRGCTIATDGSNFTAIPSTPIWNTITKTTTYTARAGDMVLADTTGGGFTVTLPLSSANANLPVRVKKTSSDGNTVTVGRTSADLIDGQTTQTFTAQYTAIEVLSDGAGNWWIS